MAITVAHLRETYGRDLVERLRGRLIMAQLCNTNFRGDVQRSNKVLINSPADDLSGSTKVDAVTAEEGRNPTFDAPVELESEQIELVMNQGSQLGVEMGIDDLREATFDMMAEANTKIARRMAFEIDSNLTAYMLGAVPGNRGGNNKSSIYGDATDYIASTGKPATATAAEFVTEAFLDASAWALGNNVWRVGLIEHELYAVMHPRLWRAVQDWINRTKPSDSLVNIYGGGPRSQLGISTGGQVTGGITSMQVFLNPYMPQATVSSKAHWQILFGTRQFTTFAARPVLYSFKNVGDFQESATIGAIVHGFSRYGRLAVNPSQSYLATIRAEA